MNTLVVFVHGMGDHKPGWSNETQQFLARHLGAVRVEPIFVESMYSDIVEGVAEPTSFEEGAATLPAEEVEYRVKVARLDAAIDMLEGRTGPGEIDTASMVGQALEALRQLNRYVVRYLVCTQLGEEIRERIRTSIERGQREAGEDARIILIGHSLGSVISWDLAADSQSGLGSRLHKLVTLGSPLGWLQRANAIDVRPIQCAWANASAPGDVVSRVEVSAPPFEAGRGFVSFRPRRVQTNPHSSLLVNPDVVRDWAFLLL